MALSHRACAALFLISVMTSDAGVLGRAVETRGILSRSPETAHGPTLRTELHRERCAELAAPWLENARVPPDNATLLQLRIRPLTPGVSAGLVFPGKSLFSFVRRVYHCCQERLYCRNIRGVQGRLRGDTDAEFVLTREILSMSVMRAELHLQLSNPQHLDIHPVLRTMAKRNLPTRYSLRSRGNTVELRVDLLPVLQRLQEATGGAAGGHRLENVQRVFSSRGSPLREEPTAGAGQDTAGDAWGQLGLLLGCSQAGSGLACESSGVRLLHTPFLALYYL